MADSQKYDRTNNLFDKSTATISHLYGTDNVYHSIGTSENVRSVILQCEPNTTYTIQKIVTNRYALWTTATYPAAGGTWYAARSTEVTNTTLTFTTEANDHYIILMLSYESSTPSSQDIFDSIMYNYGSTPLPYEPYLDWQHSLRKLGNSTDTITTLPADIYADGTNATVSLKGNMSQTGTPTPSSPIQPQECGELETSGAHSGQYKIPISSANTTTPVYLGEVQTTRKIKKLVLDGTENWTKSGNVYYITSIQPDYLRSATITTICTHYQAVTNVEAASSVNVGEIALFSKVGENQRLYIGDDRFANTTEFTAYLAAQYAAGTPVTVWYVLVNETTGIVNEPLRKIGGYVDTVSGITIPTITGKATFDVLTTLKPFEVELTYTGWHDAEVKEKSRNLFSTEGAKEGYYIDQSGVERKSSYSDYEFSYTKLLPVEPNTTYTFSINVPQHTYTRTNRRIHGYDTNGNWIEQIDNLVITDTDVGVLSLTFTTPSTCQYVIINYLNNTYPNGDTWLMLNAGSTALPYEPYWK